MICLPECVDLVHKTLYGIKDLLDKKIEII